MTAHVKTSARTGGVTRAATVRARTATATQATLTRAQMPFAGRWVLAYFPGYRYATVSAAAIDWAQLTHIAVFSAIPNNDATLDETFFLSTAANGRAWAKGVCDAARTNGVIPVLTLGGGGFKDRFVAAMSTTALRATLVTNTLALADFLGVTWIDIDYEPLEAGDIPALVAFAQALKTARPGLKLCLPCGQVNSNTPTTKISSDTAQLATWFDQINFMNYGMSNDWSGWTSWHSSPLYGHSPTHPMSIDFDVQAHLDAGIPAAKLGVGWGGHGVGWSGVTGPGQSGGAAIGNPDSDFPHGEIVSTYVPAMTRVWDDLAKVPYLWSATPVAPDQVTYLSYEDDVSIAEKVAYVKRRGLGGIILWHLPQTYRPEQPAGSRWAYLGLVKGALSSGRLEAVTPAAPTFVNSGSGQGTYTIPAVPGAEYLVAGSVVAAGTYTASGSVTVTARPVRDRTLTGGAVTSWQHTYATSTVVTNFAPNPRQVSGGTSMLESSSGSSYLTGTSGWPSDASTTTARRRTASADGTLSIAYLVDVTAVADGADMVASVDLRLNHAKTAKWSWQWYDAASATIGTSWYSSTTTAWAAGEQRRVLFPTQVKPAGATKVRLSVSMNLAVVGESIDATNVLVTTGTVAPGFFDGATPDAAGVDYAWTGAVNASASTKTT